MRKVEGCSKPNSKRKMGRICLAIVLVIMTMCSLSLVACKPEEEEKPWWEQTDKFEYVLSDERSLEKTYSYRRGEDRSDMLFTYVYDSKDDKEYIPQLKLYYDGVEQEIVIDILSRKRYHTMLESYQSVSYIHGLGKYRANLRLLLPGEDVDELGNEFDSETIDILVIKGEEK